MKNMSGGRGRGGRSTLSFNAELLGVGRGSEVLSNSTSIDPPPTFPLLTCKPHQPLRTPEHEYLLALSKDFISQMRSSPFNLHEDLQSNNRVAPARYSDRLGAVAVKQSLTGIDWKRFPSELSPLENRKRCKKVKNLENAAKRAKKDDVLSALEKLEEREDKPDADAAAEKSGTDNEEAANEGSEVEEEDEVDEELDEGTDYANNYFDNGENYLDDDDDGLDEGGIY